VCSIVVKLLLLALLAELQEVLGRTKFDRYIVPGERERFLARLVLEATLVPVTNQLQACRDSKDDQVLELAVNGSATCIISDDQDLLALNPFHGIQILTPAEFLVIQTPDA
jgi:putative PIN family toxin of toxin-antitoxin system